MASKEELIAARDAVWKAAPNLTSKGAAERIAEAALKAAEEVRLATMQKLFGPDALADGSDFVDRSGER
jgi:hypothetical protein